MDDILGVGARAPILDVMSQTQVLWKTTPLEELRLGGELQFLGTWLTICEYNGTLGYWIHQRPFTEQLGLRVSKEGALKSRSTPGEPLSYSTSMHRVDDSEEYTEQQRQQEVKRLQSLLGCLMWLAYRTRPDLVYCVGIAAALLTRDLKACSSRTRHMLQYVCSHQDAGLFYGFSEDLRSEDATLDLYGDASFAPDGGHSHTGWVLMRGSHCLAWGASRQTIIATSSCEAEVVASVTALQASFSLRLLTEELSRRVHTVLYTDNSACLTMADNESNNLRTRHISIRARLLQNRPKNVEMKFVKTGEQKADMFTKALGKKSHADGLEKISLRHRQEFGRTSQQMNSLKVEEEKEETPEDATLYDDDDDDVASHVLLPCLRGSRVGPARGD